VSLRGSERAAAIPRTAGRRNYSPLPSRVILKGDLIMPKIKRNFLYTLSCVLVFYICFCFAGCARMKDIKYDLTIKVKNNYDSEWIFTPDIQELYYEFEYTGEDMTFYIDSYKLADHPDWGDKWCGLTGEGANVFDFGIIYGDGDKWLYEVEKINERGSYSISVIANATSNLWNFRSVRLYVNVI
jgi:hypothetical protein